MRSSDNSCAPASPVKLMGRNEAGQCWPWARLALDDRPDPAVGRQTVVPAERRGPAPMIGMGRTLEQA